MEVTMAKEKEILRVVVLDDGDIGEVQVTNNLPYRKSPGLCGHLLADIVRHFEQIFEEEGLKNGLESMVGYFLSEWKRGSSPICRRIRRQRGPDKPTTPIVEKTQTH